MLRPGSWAATLSGTGCSAAWLARLLWVQEVAGSNPASPTTNSCGALGYRDSQSWAHGQPMAVPPGIRDDHPSWMQPGMIAVTQSGCRDGWDENELSRGCAPPGHQAP